MPVLILCCNTKSLLLKENTSAYSRNNKNNCSFSGACFPAFDASDHRVSWSTDETPSIFSFPGAETVDKQSCSIISILASSTPFFRGRLQWRGLITRMGISPSLGHATALATMTREMMLNYSLSSTPLPSHYLQP